jgi:phosphoenolpyruvate carboxykinase (GTP)
MADYFNHWLNMGRAVNNPPPIFRVNWFRRDENNKFMWPGYGQNMRVLKWIVDRVQGKARAVESPIGLVPKYLDMEWEGLDYPRAKFQDLMRIDREAGVSDARSQEELFDKFFDRVPKEMLFERELLKSRLWRAPAVWELASERV